MTSIQDNILNILNFLFYPGTKELTQITEMNAVYNKPNATNISHLVAIVKKTRYFSPQK